jgi:hypothetical protein
MEKQNVVVTEVDDFIKHWTSGELIFTPETQNMTITFKIGKNFLGMIKKHTVNLPNEIGRAVATYQFHKDFRNPQATLESAYHVLVLVQKARAFGLIRDPKQQTREYEQEIEQLKERVNSLTELNNKLALENKRLHNLLGGNSRGGAEVGDVE